MQTFFRLCLAVALAGLLSGCFFVVRHGVETAIAPAHCVRNDAKVGDTFAEKGGVYEVTRLTGDAPYLCRRAPESMRMGAEARVVPANPG